MFNRENLNISSMNYGDVENVAKAIEINGDVIYESLNNIRLEFIKMQEAGFAGSTLEATIEALDKVRNVPEKVQETCKQFSTFAYQAVSEVKEAESKNEYTLEQIVTIDPMTFEVPEWSIVGE